MKELNNKAVEASSCKDLLDRPQQERDNVANAVAAQFECEYCKDAKQMVIEGVVYDQQGRQHQNPTMPCPLCWKAV